MKEGFPDDGKAKSLVAQTERITYLADGGVITEGHVNSLNMSTDEVRDTLAEAHGVETENIHLRPLPSDGHDWTVGGAKSDVANSKYEIRKVFYRPFDTRYIFYSGKTKGLVAYPRHSTSKHLLKDNLSLITLRINGENERFVSIIADNLIEKGSLASGNYSFFPLYLYHDDGTRTANFNLKVLKEFTKNLQSSYEPEDILDYIYAVLSISKYRQKYKEFLKIDFPRVPVPKNDTQFNDFVKIGTQLRQTHLLKDPELDKQHFMPTGEGNWLVQKVAFTETKSGKGNVYVNDTQYFADVPKSAWEFYIGGYQPAQKWLKDRKGRELTHKDISYYQKITAALQKTIELQKKLDEIWEA